MKEEKIWIEGYGYCQVWELPKVSPKKQREGKYISESFIHPAKMDVELCRKIIETYTLPGETVLDPMAGIGTTLIEAGYMGRNAIGVELEKKFVEIAQKNIKLLEKKSTLTPKGRARIIEGDARKLQELLATEVNSIVFSPPYAEGIGHDSGDKASEKFKERLEMQRRYTRLMNLSYKSVDAVVTSPPFFSTVQERGPQGSGEHNIAVDPVKHGHKGIITLYTESKENIDNIPEYGNIDMAATSQTGSAKKETYLEAMFKVYSECYKVLKPGGKMIIVVKDFIRNKKVVRLDLDTKKLCEVVGFKWIETKLFKVPRKSFWRILFERRFPNIDISLLQWEFVMVFEKPLESEKLD